MPSEGIGFTKGRVLRIALAAIVLGGCAGFQRSCSAFNAESFSADWIVVQYDYTMKPQHCWKLVGTPVASEGADGLYWLDSNGGNVIHVAGWYGRVQVQSGRWADAASAVGVNASQCANGLYPAKAGA